MPFLLHREAVKLTPNQTQNAMFTENMISISAIQQLAGRYARGPRGHVHRPHDGGDPGPDGRPRGVQGDPRRGRQGVQLDRRAGARGRVHRQAVPNTRRPGESLHHSHCFGKRNSLLCKIFFFFLDSFVHSSTSLSFILGSHQKMERRQTTGATARRNFGCGIAQAAKYVFHFIWSTVRNTYFVIFFVTCFFFVNCKIDNELLRRQFAEKANAVGPWIERQLDAVTAIGLGLQVIVFYKAVHELSVF